MNVGFFTHSILKSYAIPGLVVIMFGACQPENKNTNRVNSNQTAPVRKDFTVISPSPDQKNILGETISFSFKPQNDALVVDSIEVFIDGTKKYTERHQVTTFNSKTIFSKVGRQNVHFKIFYNHNLMQTLSAQVFILPDNEPVNLKYQLLRKISHDTLAYTEGLVYYKGYIYESTGQKRMSRLRQINPANGEILKDRKLEDNFFGEGLTILNDKIYQLTYQTKVGFVYDLETFELIRKFDLQTNEGWGMTNDGKNLILSDGSSQLYYYDPEYFTQIDQLDVCDKNGIVEKINELEFVKGTIWANIYGEPYLVKIEAKSGKVLARLDLKNLFPAGIPDNLDYVLNGIAYNPESDTFYITGKYWPVMYEIKIIG